MRVGYILFFLLISNSVLAQVYTEKQTRHRFAQLNFGIDLAVNSTGNSFYQNQKEEKAELVIPTSVQPRLIFGGTHFWGHADFTLSIPLYHQTFKRENQTIDYRTGVETALKFYPWRIENRKLRPYIGVAMHVFEYEQDNGFLNWGDGSNLQLTRYPILSGLTYNFNNQLFELGASYNYQYSTSYYYTQYQSEKLNLPNFQFHFSYRFIIDTSISAEDSWESGRTREITEKLAGKKRLNRVFVGAGLSSAFWLDKSEYNTQNHPSVEKFPISIFPDLSVGYYFYKPDLNIALAFRNYKAKTGAYGVDQEAKRMSLGLEVTKFLFDYHGFAPFLGPILSWENLNFKERQEGAESIDASKSKLTYGFTFGWDIRINQLQSWLLRTNLRWSPQLELDIEQSKPMLFNSLEFNFIQLVIFPEYLF